MLSRALQPFTNVLLSGSTKPDKAMHVAMRISAVEGRLPQHFVGSTLTAWAENPDKLRLDAPVLGEQFTVVRNGSEVWATPGDKIELLLNNFQEKPQPSSKNNTPLSLPITAQQSVFFVALFDVEKRGVAEIDTVGNEEFRIITTGLQKDLAATINADDFRASLWIDHAYRPRRILIKRQDFSAVVDFLQLRFTPTLPAATWSAPETNNIYRTSAENLEALLFVVINSLQPNP